MPNRPPWVIKELAEILGFDQETVVGAILPELESQNHQVKLQSYLQDFLGPSSKSQSFIERYIAFRFPSIPTPTPAPLPSLKAKSKPSSGVRTPSTPAYPNGQSNSSYDIAQSVQDAFGSKGNVYQKKDDGFGRSLAGGGGSAGGSGSNTPNYRGSNVMARQAGAMTIVDSRLDSKGKGKGKAVAVAGGGKGDKIWDVPKSKETLRLEGLKDRLHSVQAGEKVKRADEIPDCFCQARVHKLSTYTPHCPHCGLILCTLQPPYMPCPSCSNQLYSSAQLARLIQRLSIDIETQLSIEQSQRDAEEAERQARLIAESGGGAFPTLPGSTPSAGRPNGGGMVNTQNGRKVLTIGKGGKGKAVLTTTTYKPATPPPSTNSSAQPTSAPIPTDIVPRPRSPPLDSNRIEKEWSKVCKWREEVDRPWGDIKADKKGEGWSYMELPISLMVEEDSMGRRKAAKKKKKEAVGENGRVVPGAQAAE